MVALLRSYELAPMTGPTLSAAGPLMCAAGSYPAHVPRLAVAQAPFVRNMSMHHELGS